MRRYLTFGAVLFLALCFRAFGDYNATQGSGTIFRAFDSGNGGTSLCAAANTQCQAVGLVNSAGAEIGTAASPVSVSAVGLAQGSTTSGQTGSLVMGAVTTAAPSYTNAQTSPVSLRTDGAQRSGLYAGIEGGCTPAKTLSAASTNATNIKASAGTLCKMVAVNTAATIYYLKLYNTAGAPTCNSDTVVGTFPVPPSNGGIAIPLGPFGEAYSTGIGFCLTGALADNDNTSAATGVAISYSFK